MSDPSHVDLSVLWVPIMPETSKLGDEMEKVGQDATESFAKGSSGLGDKIHESVTKSRDKIKDVFHRTGSDAGKSMSDAFKEETKTVEDTAEDVGKKSGEKVKGGFRTAAGQLGKEMVQAIGPDVKEQLGKRVGDVVGGAFKNAFGDSGISKQIGEAVGSAASTGVKSWLDDLQGKLGGVKDTVNTTKQAFADLTGGKTTQGVAGLADSFGKLGTTAKQFGVEVGDLPQPIQDVIGKTAELKLTAQGFADVFKALPGTIGKVGTALTELAGPLAALGATMYQLRDLEKQGLTDKTDASGHEDWWKFAGGVGGSWLEDKYNRLFHGHGTPGGSGGPGVDMGGVGGIGTGGDVLGSSSDGYDAFSSGGSVTGPGSIQAPAPSAPVSTAPSSFTASMPDSFSSPADLHAGGSRVANLFAVAQSLQGTPYSQALRNDCSGMVSKLATAALGMSPSVQFSTVNEGSWLMSHGFKPGMGGPNDLSIGWYDHGGGNNGHTAATLPGGINAESGGSHGNFMLGPGAAGANDPQFSQHAYLPMSGGKTPPLGSKDDPIFTSFADDGSGSTGGAGGDSTGAEGFGSQFLSGIAQSVGLDGSVFKTFNGKSSPLDFGSTKMATGLINWGMGMAQQKGSPGLSPTRGSSGVGDTHNYYGNVGPQMNVTQHGVQDGVEDWQHAANSSRGEAPNATSRTVPMTVGGNLPG